jgi:hypothetical protein
LHRRDRLTNIKPPVEKPIQKTQYLTSFFSNFFNSNSGKMADSNLILVPASFQFIPNNLQNKGGQAVSGLSRGQFAT